MTAFRKVSGTMRTLPNPQDRDVLEDQPDIRRSLQGLAWQIIALTQDPSGDAEGISAEVAQDLRFRLIHTLDQLDEWMDRRA